MSTTSTVLTIVSYAGASTALAALVQSFAGRKEIKAHATTMIMEANTEFARTVHDENTRLIEANRELRKAMVALSHAMDRMLDVITVLIDTPEFAGSESMELALSAINVAREANAAAKIIL